MDTTVFFQVPKSANGPTAQQPHKEYRISSSLLPNSYLQEHHQGPYQAQGDGPKSIILRNTTVEEFDVYMTYLNKKGVKTLSEMERNCPYSLVNTLGRIIGLNKDPSELRLTAEAMRNDYNHLLSCHMLGSTLHDSRFEDAIITRILGMLRGANGHQSQFIRLMTKSVVEAIANHYGTNSPLFRVAVKAYARFATLHELDQLAFSNYPASFKCHMMKELGRLRQTQHLDGAAALDFAIGDCNYHSHTFYGYCPLRPSDEKTG